MNGYRVLVSIVLVLLTGVTVQSTEYDQVKVKQVVDVNTILVYLNDSLSNKVTVVFILSTSKKKTLIV